MDKGRAEYLVEARLRELRKLSYSRFLSWVKEKHYEVAEVEGCQLTEQAFFDDKKKKTIRVTVDLHDPEKKGFLGIFFTPRYQSDFILAPDNSFVDETLLESWWIDYGQSKLRSLLMQHWDPIGVSDEPEAQDEYDDYIPGVMKVLRDNPTPRAVSAYLGRIEKEYIEQPSGRTGEAGEVIARWYKEKRPQKSNRSGSR